MGVARTPASFRASIEMRLKKLVDPARGRSLHRLRVLMVMERFIARMNDVLPDSAVLKGGLALELRLDRARTTKDIDLRVLGNPNDLKSHLRAIQALRPEPEDHFQFTITADKDHPTVTGHGVVYGGLRFKVTTTLAGKPYVRFGLDVAFGDPIHGEPTMLKGSDFFDKYGIPPVAVRTYPVTTHLAEKLHAYTLPRDRVNMRLKDLVDMPLIAGALDGIGAANLHEALGLTFDFRGSHALPSSLPLPPREWLGPFDRLRRDEGLAWADLDDLHAAAAALINPILAGVDGTWLAAEGRWCLIPVPRTARRPVHPSGGDLVSTSATGVMLGTPRLKAGSWEDGGAKKVPASGSGPSMRPSAASARFGTKRRDPTRAGTHTAPRRRTWWSSSMAA